MKDFKLHDYNPKSGFKFPENYFDHFPEMMMQVLPQREPKTISIFGGGKSWILAAAAILILALAIPILNKLTVSGAQPDIMTLENYISYQSEISNDDIVDLLEAEDIRKIQIDYNLEDKAVEDVLVSDTDLEQYIIN